MGRTNNIQVHVVADTAQYNAAMTEAGATAQKFGRTVDEAGAAQTAIAGERQLAAQAQTTAQVWAQARMAMLASEQHANTVLRAGRKADVASASAALDELDARHDAFLAATRAYYEGLTRTQQSAYAEQEAAANRQIESEYQRLAARLDLAAAIDADTAATDTNTAAVTFNSQAQREATYTVGEALTGRYGRLETTLLSLGARTGIMAQLLTPLGISMLGAAGAAVAFGAAMVEGEVHAGELNSALLVTDDAVGFTRGQLQGMAADLATGDVTIGEARNAVLDLARSGRFSGDAFREAAAAVVDFARLTGQSTQQASHYVEELARASTQQLIQANAQYHFLTFAQFKHIEDLRKEGRAAEATKAIMDDFYASMASREEKATADEGLLLRSLHAVERAFSATWAAMENAGAPETYAQKLAHLQAELANFQNAGNVTSAAGYTIASSGRVEQIRAEITALQEQHRMHQMAAWAASNAAHWNQAAIESQYGAGVTHASQSPGSGAAESYGAEQARAALQRLTQARQQAAEKEIADDGRALSNLLSVDNAKAASAQRVLQIRVQTADQALNEAVQAGQMSAAQREAIEVRLTDALYQQDLKRLDDELATLTPGTAAYQRVAAQVEALQAEHYGKLGALDLAYQATKRHQEQTALADRRRHVMQVESIENQLMSGLISGRMTFANMERTLAQQVAATEIESAMHSVTETLLLHKTASLKTLAIKAETGLKTIEADAAQAAAGAYKAMVGIPYVGPFLAPAAAAMAFATVGAYKALVSFDIGAYNIPQDVTARVHAGEMILPRPFAEEARSRGFLGGGDRGGRRGDVHLHLHTPDTEGARSFLLDNSDALADAVRKAFDEGNLL